MFARSRGLDEGLCWITVLKKQSLDDSLSRQDEVSRAVLQGSVLVPDLFQVFVVPWVMDAIAAMHYCSC